MLQCFGFLVFFSCQPQAASAATVPYCDVARPVLVSPRDSPRTIRAASTELKKWKRFCASAKQLVQP